MTTIREQLVPGVKHFLAGALSVGGFGVLAERLESSAPRAKKIAQDLGTFVRKNQAPRGQPVVESGVTGYVQ
jgi:hypothetical protein